MHFQSFSIYNIDASLRVNQAMDTWFLKIGFAWEAGICFCVCVCVRVCVVGVCVWIQARAHSCVPIPEAINN